MLAAIAHERAPGILALQIAPSRTADISAVGVCLPAAPDERFFGLGERFSGLDLTGQVVEKAMLDFGEDAPVAARYASGRPVRCYTISTPCSTTARPTTSPRRPNPAMRSSSRARATAAASPTPPAGLPATRCGAGIALHAVGNLLSWGELHTAFHQLSRLACQMHATLPHFTHHLPLLGHDVCIIDIRHPGGQQG
jgi:hypothetical protein